MRNILIDCLGIEAQSVSHKERIISGLGAFLGIFFVFLVSQFFIDGKGSMIIVASMGSSAVLLFAVPHGSLSQPWALLGGHTLSALIGVTCAQLIENPLYATSIAVGLAVTVMYYARCTHPPGGATALGAVVGGPVVHDLGYKFVLAPVLLNTIIILTIAILFNALFDWRRYPVSINAPRKKLKALNAQSKDPLTSVGHEDFVYALSQIDTFIDVSESDLLHIYDLATNNIEVNIQEKLKIEINKYYSNGEFGGQWSVRQVTVCSKQDDEVGDILTYKVVAGLGRRKTAQATREEFERWAMYEVYRDEDNWRRVV